MPADKRGEVVRFEGGFTVINDSYNSSPTALDALAELLAATPGYRRRILAAGEMRELGTSSPELHRECGRHAAANRKDRLDFRRAGARGRICCAPPLRRGIRESERQFFENSEEAAKFLASFVAAGDLLLLKGSRGVKMEKILEAMDAQHARVRRSRPVRRVRCEAGRKGAAEMLYYLFFFVLRPHFSPLNVFRYITVRTAVASLTALLLSLLLGPWVIARLRELQVKQYHSRRRAESASGKSGNADDGRRADRRCDRDSHVAVGRSAQSCTCCSRWARRWLSARSGLSTITTKWCASKIKGLTARGNFLLQVLTCMAVGAVLLGLQARGAYSTQLSVPFFKRLHPDLVIDSLLGHQFIWPLAFVPFVIFLVLVIVGISNARESHGWSGRPGDRLRARLLLPRSRC